MNRIFFPNDDATTEIVTFMRAGPHSFTQDNCLLSMDAPHKPAIYLRFTAQVYLLIFGRVVFRNQSDRLLYPTRSTFITADCFIVFARVVFYRLERSVFYRSGRGSEPSFIVLGRVIFLTGMSFMVFGSGRVRSGRAVFYITPILAK